ncbi:hypothetical protein K440DRAFT_643294 [Wilcoxina mikolae CBS 423.85]|nr:hypothetical protein K440DRAFT_643294 [Wilcoxina mikolae CBS 423.85]
MTTTQFRSPEERANEYKLLFDTYHRTIEELESTKQQLSIKESQLQFAQVEAEHLKQQLRKLKSVFDGLGKDLTDNTKLLTEQKDNVTNSDSAIVVAKPPDDMVATRKDERSIEECRITDEKDNWLALVSAEKHNSSAIVPDDLWAAETIGHPLDGKVHMVLTYFLAAHVHFKPPSHSETPTPAILLTLTISSMMTASHFRPPEEHASEYKLLYDTYNRAVTELATTKHQLSVKESELNDARSENLELYKRMRMAQEEGQHAREQLRKLKSVFDDLGMVVSAF